MSKVISTLELVPELDPAYDCSIAEMMAGERYIGTHQVLQALTREFYAHVKKDIPERAAVGYIKHIISHVFNFYIFCHEEGKEVEFVDNETVEACPMIKVFLDYFIGKNEELVRPIIEKYQLQV